MDATYAEQQEGQQQVESQLKVKTFGSKKDVFLGRARKTRGGLLPVDLIQNKRGKVVSKKKSEMARERAFLAGNNKNGINYYIQQGGAAGPEEPLVVPALDPALVTDSQPNYL